MASFSAPPVTSFVKDLFVIISTVNPCSTPYYDPGPMKMSPELGLIPDVDSTVVIKNRPRSVYSTEDRFNQTLETIKSVRKYAPGAKCFLFENSRLTKNQQDRLVRITGSEESNLDRADRVILSSDCPVASFFRDGQNKSLGEIYSLIKFIINVVGDGKIQFRRLFKLSGRYRLNSKFDSNAFPVEGMCGFRVLDPSVPDYPFFHFSTVLYSVPKDYISRYLSVLCDILLCMNIRQLNLEKRMVDVETGLYDRIPSERIKEIGLLGVEGNVSCSGDKIEH